MFTHLREDAKGIFVKILLGLLVLSFGIWGIGDIFRTGSGSTSIATVDKTPISVPEYQRALHNRQEELRARLGKAYSPEIAKRFGLESMVCTNELINNLIINTEATTLGIAVSDEDIAKAISNNPAFHDKDGKPSKEIFLATLKNNGFSEQRYVADIRKDMGAKLLAETLTSGVVVPNELVEALYKSREEQRAASIIFIPPSAIKHVPAPTDKEINAYYTAHAKSFLTPEYRTISYVEIKPADISAKIDVPEKEITQIYQERIQDFHRPERRQIEQMLFEKEADAKAASDKIAKGQKFTDIAKSANILNKDKISIGLVSKQEVPEQAAEQVFALADGGTTHPIQSDFGWHIFHVSKIVPEETAPLVEVRAEIIKELAAKKATETALRLSNQLEDELASGKSLEAAAEKVGQKVSKVSQVTNDGKTADGKKAAIPPYDNFLNVAFATAEKDNSQATQGSDGSYFLVHVDNVDPEHARPLAEVKNNIVAALNEEKTATELKNESEDIAIQMRSGKKPDAALASHGISGTANYTANLKRSSQSIEGNKKPVPQKLVAEIFKIAPNEPSHAYKTANGEYAIAILKQITPAPQKPDPKVIATISDELKKSLGNEVLEDYFYYLRDKHKVVINEAAMGARDEEAGD